MTELFTVIASGLAAASFYIIFGLGLAVVYRTTGVLNFSYGAVGSAAGYLAYTLLGHGLPYFAAAAVAVVMGIVLSVLIHVLLLRFLPNRSPEAAGIATLGITILIEGVLLLIYGGNADALPNPMSEHTIFTIGKFQVETVTLFDIGIAIVATTAVGILLYRSRTGLAVRAMSEGSQTAAMFGISPDYAKAIVWGIAGCLAALTALLVTPSYYLTPDFLTSFLIAAFVVVVLGGFERLMGVVIGAIIFGVLQSIFSTYVTGQLTNTISFGIILVVLIFLPYGLLGRKLPSVPEATIPRAGVALLARVRRRLSVGGESAIQRLSRIRALGTRRITLAGPLVAGIIAIAIGPLLGSSSQLVGTNIAAMFIAVLGADFIFGFTGQLSIGQSGFMLIGSYVAVLLEMKLNVPFLLALVAAVLSGAVGGAVLGLPAIRLRGVYLAVLTLAFALAVPELITYFASFTGGDNGLLDALPLWIGSGNSRSVHIYDFVVIVAAVMALVFILIARSRWGRDWRAIRDSDMAAAASGISVARQRVIAFAIGSAFCALGGALLASVTGYLSPQSFDLWTSIYLLVAVVIGGRVSVLGSLLGAAFIVGVPYESASIPALSNLLLGALLIIILLIRPDGLRGVIVDFFGWIAQVWSQQWSRYRKPLVVPATSAHLEESTIGDVVQPESTRSL
jgi:branched-chain amino acid transport system permease protein